MNAGIAPRRTSHRGFVAAGGFWFDPSLIGADRMAERILTLWREGCVMHGVAGGVLIILPSLAVVESRSAPGVVLTRRDGLLMGAPLSERELARLEPPRGSALLCREGRIRAYPLNRETMLDPAVWLDVEDFVAQASRPLGAPPSPAVAARGIEPAPLESHYGPELMRPPDEKAELLKSLKASRRPGTRKARLSLREWISSMLHSSGTRQRSGKTAGTKPSPFRRAPSSSWLGRTFAPLRRVLGSWLFRSPLAGYLGQKQARYLEKMTSLFEENDLDQALRYAIPFATIEEMVRASTAFSPPSPRSDLSITVGPARGSTSVVHLMNNYRQYLIDLYRQACERLERAGEIEKAAFVLLELLKEDKEAIALLERHGRFRFAAEVAQARGLPPGMVIRLWFLAGEPAQAVRVARTTGAFADAVLRLERTHPEEAKKLRIIWADFLADAGNYGAAVDAAWKVPEARRLIMEWIERGIRLEGSIAARLMVKKVALDPDCLKGILPKIREVVYDILPGGMRAKLSMGKAILEHAGNPGLRALSGFLLRELLKDMNSVTFNPGFDSVIRALKDITSDRLLVEDLPVKSPPIPALTAQDCLALRRDAVDVGLHRLYDGVCLPSGRLLVALGEAGVQVLSRKGTVVAHLDCPADRLVVNDSGNRAIAIAHRGELCRLARIDLEKLKEQYWCDAAIDSAADTYDGEVWFAAHQDALMAVDALSGRFESIWQVADLHGPILALARNSSALGLLVGIAGAPEHWTYELPRMTLRQRDVIFPHCVDASLYAVMPKGSYACCVLSSAVSPDERKRFVVRVAMPGFKTERGFTGPASVWQSREIEDVPEHLLVYEHLCVVTTETAEGRRVLFFRPGQTTEPAVQLDLIDARSAGIRRYANTFCIVDDCGRLLVMSPEDFRIIRDAKV